MKQETPKLYNKKLPPVVLGICSALRGSLAFLLSPQSGLMGKKHSKRGELGSAAFCLWNDALCLHNALEGHWSYQGSNWKSQDRIPAVPPEDLTWNFYLEIHGREPQVPVSVCLLTTDDLSKIQYRARLASSSIFGGFPPLEV